MTTATKYESPLATYFSSQSLYLDAKQEKNPNTRKLSEQPWQHTKAEMLKEGTDKDKCRWVIWDWRILNLWVFSKDKLFVI